MFQNSWKAVHHNTHVWEPQLKPALSRINSLVLFIHLPCPTVIITIQPSLFCVQNMRRYLLNKLYFMFIALWTFFIWVQYY